MNEKTTEQKVIFILGIMPRSGTHFLANLLAEHPDCAKSVIPEDGLLARSTFLVNYTNRNFRQWDFEGDLPEIPIKELLLEGLGEGLKMFLWRARRESMAQNSNRATLHSNEQPKYLITKTPQVLHLEKFFQFFPNEKLLIIVRDGRSLVESICNSFGYRREEAIRDWAEAVAKIKTFEEACKKAKREYLIIKYEKLHTDTEPEIRKVLKFLGLDEEGYDFQSALQIPVVGSSVFKRGEGAVHWSPVSKTPEFDPLARASNWTRKQHERFNRIAKPGLLYLGYEPKTFTGSGLYWKTWNNLQDLKEGLRTRIRKIIKLFIIIVIKLKNHLKRK